MVGDSATPPRPVLIVTPYSLETNPYVRLLVDGLRGEGARVELARGKSPIVLLRALRRHGIPRVVHLQWHHPYLIADGLPATIGRTFLFLVQCALLRALGARIVWTVHNLISHERQRARWELFACRLLARLADALVAHCDAAALEVAEAYRVPLDRVRVVPHGIAVDSGSAAGDRSAVRRDLGVGTDDVLLLNFGRIRPYKGIERLIVEFRSVAGGAMALAIVGFPDDPALARELERLADGDPRIHLRLQAVEDAELGRLISACDAVVLPYRDTLTSGAAVLAAAHGRPVIAPRMGCLREWPEDGGILYDDTADEGLGPALKQASEAPLSAMGAVARQHVGQWPWERVAQRTNGVYTEVSEGTRKAVAGL